MIEVLRKIERHGQRGGRTERNGIRTPGSHSLARRLPAWRATRPVVAQPNETPDGPRGRWNDSWLALFDALADGVRGDFDVVAGRRGGELMLLHAAGGAPREPFGQHPVPDDLHGPAGRDEPGCIDAPPAAPVEPHVSACGGGRGVDRRVDGHHPLPRPAARSPTNRVELAGHAGSF